MSAQGIAKGIKISEKNSSYIKFAYPIKLSNGSKIENIVIEMSLGESYLPEMKSYLRNIYVLGVLIGLAMDFQHP